MLRPALGSRNGRGAARTPLPRRGEVLNCSRRIAQSCNSHSPAACSTEGHKDHISQRKTPNAKRQMQNAKRKT